jgi:hypothetical protein
VSKFHIAAILAAGLPGTMLSAQAAPPVPAQSPAATPAAQPADDAALDGGEGRAVALKLADELELKFTISASGADYAKLLRANAAEGRYDQGSRGALAKLLTDDLQALHKDGHLHVMVADGDDGPRGGGGDAPKRPPMIQSARTIAPGIGYIRFTAFSGRPDEVAAVKAFMAENAQADAIIFDLRNHHGGGLAEMNEIFPYLFAERTPLVKMEIARAIYDKEGTPFPEGPAMSFAKGPAKVTATHYAIPNDSGSLRKAKIYLLVSNATVSAAEHFALAMKSTGRATLIGEATGGANHFGGPVPLNDHFAVWLPIGRTYDIKTGKDWEGDGVAPDIAIDPTQALVVALERAGLSHADAVRLDAQEVPAEPVHRDQLRAR